MSAATAMKVASLCRYPVKGLKAQALDSVTLEPGKTIPFDRAWAIENGKGRFDADDPQHLPKINFLMLMRDERLAALDIEFDETDGSLALFRNGKQVVKGALTTPLGCQLIEQFIAGYMENELRGAPHIVHAPGHNFTDVAVKCLHIANMASVRELERSIGKPVDPQRFRANIYFEAEEPWVELGWIGKKVVVGGAEFEVIDRTTRCAATNVDPATAARDMAIPATLSRAYGHEDFGVYAVVKSGGVISTGDALSVGT